MDFELTVTPADIRLTALSGAYGPFPLMPEWRDPREGVRALRDGLWAVARALHDSEHPALPADASVRPALVAAGLELSFPAIGWAEGYDIRSITEHLETTDGPATRFYRARIDEAGRLEVGAGELVVTPWAP